MGNTLSYKKDFGLILVGAIIFTASFLWKDYLTDVEEVYFPKGKGLLGRLFFVIIVSVLLVVLAVHLKDVFGISSKDRNTINFDDSPLDDNNGIDSIGDLIGADNLDIDNFETVDDNQIKPIKSIKISLNLPVNANNLA